MIQDRSPFILFVFFPNYSKGEATFETENVSTISIIKDFLTKEATKRRTKLEILLGKFKIKRTHLCLLFFLKFYQYFIFCKISDVNRASVSFIIGLIESKLVEHINIHKNYQMTSNLIDLDIQDDAELKSLGFDYADILENKNKIIDQYTRTSLMLERLKKFINGIYMDYNKLRGIDVDENASSEKLNELIDKNYNNESLVNFILGVTSNEIVEKKGEQHLKYENF